MITVYSQPGCQPCRATIRALQTLRIPHQVIDVTEDDDATEFVLSLGYLQTPVVVVDDGIMESWSGFRPDKIEMLKDTT